MTEHCAACGSSELIELQEVNHVTHRDIKGQVVTFFSECKTCGSEVVTDNQSKKNKRSLMAFKKTCDGLLSGQEITAIREKLAITQGEAASIFGGGSNAFTKYENDDVMQSVAMDKLIRLAYESPDVFSRLREKAGLTAYEHYAKRVVRSYKVQIIENESKNTFTSDFTRRRIKISTRTDSVTTH